MPKVILESKFNKGMKKIEEKIRSMPYGDLIHVSKRDDFENGRTTYIYPSYGFYCGYVPGNMLEIVSSFANTLKKACTLCKNYRYNGYNVLEDEYYERFYKHKKN